MESSVELILKWNGKGNGLELYKNDTVLNLKSETESKMLLKRQGRHLGHLVDFRKRNLRLSHFWYSTEQIFWYRQIWFSLWPWLEYVLPLMKILYVIFCLLKLLLFYAMWGRNSQIYGWAIDGWLLISFEKTGIQ